MISNILFDAVAPSYDMPSYSELYWEHQEALKALRYSLEVIDELQKIVARQNKRIEFLSNNTVLSLEEK